MQDNIKRKKSFIILGIILIAVGFIMFIVSATELYNVQNTRTHWAEGFMQDYQARTNATNAIPCYMFMILAIIFVIAGVVMLCIKPKSNIVLMPNIYSASNLNNNSKLFAYCPSCRNHVEENDMFCKTCGYNLKQNYQNNLSEVTCRYCGGINEYGNKFCIICGKKL